MKAYLIRCGDALSQLVNVVLLFGKNPNESISGRSYRLNHKHGWKQLEVVIDFLFSPWSDQHCKEAYLADLGRAYDLIETK